MNPEKIKQAVREQYGRIGALGTASTGCCGATEGPSCCPGGAPDDTSAKLGYSQEELDAVPEGANLGLGCGNPQAIASLAPGEVVLDLGSGGGFDCFLAAKQVGETGRVIGVDMTSEMISRARANGDEAGATNVEFRLGEIEHLPVESECVDVIISNCVINISAEKLKVYREAFRVLKPGGRLAISDVIASAPLPEEVRKDVALQAGCLAGASTVAELQATLAQAGFEDVRIEPKTGSKMFIRDWAPGSNLEDFVMSADIQATRPR